MKVVRILREGLNNGLVIAILLSILIVFPVGVLTNELLLAAEIAAVGFVIIFKTFLVHKLVKDNTAVAKKKTLILFSITVYTLFFKCATVCIFGFFNDFYHYLSGEYIIKYPNYNIYKDIALKNTIIPIIFLLIILVLYKKVIESNKKAAKIMKEQPNKKFEFKELEKPEMPKIKLDPSKQIKRKPEGDRPMTLEEIMAITNKGKNKEKTTGTSVSRQTSSQTSTKVQDYVEKNKKIVRRRGRY